MKALVIFAVCVGMIAGQVIEIHNDQDDAPHIDCHSLYKAGYTKNGTYKLTFNGEEFLAPCEFRGGYGFTIFLNRMDSTVKWNKNWDEYIAGFGLPFHDYFCGLDHLHDLCHNGNTMLEVHMEDWDGETRYMKNSHFYVGDRISGYRLTVNGKYEGNVRNDLAYNNGRRFYTVDHADPYGCAYQQEGGWWYYACTKALPTGRYYKNGNYSVKHKFGDGLYWGSFRGDRYSLKRLVMALRRKV